MKKKALLTLLIFLVVLSGCATLSKNLTNEHYGKLCSAALISADKVNGTFRGHIPPDFDAAQFLALVKTKIPDDYYSEYKGKTIKVDSRGTYYLLKIYDDHESLILFDYSCTPEIDGPVLRDPGKYDLTNLDQYDKCASHNRLN